MMFYFHDLHIFICINISLVCYYYRFKGQTQKYGKAVSTQYKDL